MKVKEAKELFENMFKGIDDEGDAIFKVDSTNLDIIIKKLRIEVTKTNKEVMTGIIRLD